VPASVNKIGTCGNFRDASLVHFLKLISDCGFSILLSEVPDTRPCG
jgi:hypothetical protein